MTDRFKITGASARSKSEFAIGLNIFPLDEEDPYTIFLTYDGAQKQPWSRGDGNRNLSDITHLPNHYIGLSDEEFVYEVDGKSIKTEKIKGMGIHAKSAEHGAGLVIQNIDETIFIAGQGRQIYRREGVNEWLKIPTKSVEPGERQRDVHFDSIDGQSITNFYVCGKTKTAFHFNRDLEAQMDAAIDADDDDEIDRIYDLIEADDPKPEGRAYHWDGSDWTEIDVEDYFPKTVFMDSKGRAWLGCDRGTILHVERDEDGDFDVDDIEIIEESRAVISSITEFKGRLIMASTAGLFAYNEDFDSLDDEIVRIKPKLNKKLHSNPSPLKVQAVDDVMYYFDYNLGIYIWDGDKTWTNIPIPAELLERDFKGLK